MSKGGFLPINSESRILVEQQASLMLLTLRLNINLLTIIVAILRNSFLTKNLHQNLIDFLHREQVTRIADVTDYSKAPDLKNSIFT